MSKSFAVHLKSGARCDLTFTEDTLTAADIHRIVTDETLAGEISDGLWVDPQFVAAIEIIKQ